MKKYTIEEDQASFCPTEVDLASFRGALHIISGRWTIEILFVLHSGTKRFGELKRAIPGITQHMLTARLRELEEQAMVAREIYAEVPPRVEYTLTGKALGLKPVFAELLRWAGTHAGEAISEPSPGARAA